MSMAKASKFWNYYFFSENNRPLLIHPFQLESLVQGLLLSVHLIVDSGLAWHSSFNVEAILKIPIPFITSLWRYFFDQRLNWRKIKSENLYVNALTGNNFLKSTCHVCCLTAPFDDTYYVCTKIVIRTQWKTMSELLVTCYGQILVQRLVFQQSV